MKLEELAKKVQALQDIEDIKNLHTDYVFCLINHQWGDIVNYFAENAVADIWHHGVGRGKDGIAKLFMDVIAKEVTWDSGHLLAQPVISVDGDTAKGHWILYIFFPGPPARWVQGRYDCEYIKVDGKWKFSSLKYTAPWPRPPESTG